MKITPQMARIIRATVENPLGEGEMRRLPGMGDLFVSLVEPGKHNDSKHNHLYDVRVDGVAYHIYGGVSQ